MIHHCLYIHFVYFLGWHQRIENATVQSVSKRTEKGQVTVLTGSARRTLHTTIDTIHIEQQLFKCIQRIEIIVYMYCKLHLFTKHFFFFGPGTRYCEYLIPLILCVYVTYQ